MHQNDMYDIKSRNIDTFGSLRELNTRDKAVELHVFVLAQQLHDHTRT